MVARPHPTDTAIGDPDGVDNDEPQLGRRAGGDGLEVCAGDGAGTAVPHLLEVGGGAHVAHEEHALRWFHFGAVAIMST
jgi:hypothetical protein